MVAASADGESAPREAVDKAPRRTEFALAIGLAIFAQLDLRFDLDNSTRYGSGFATAVVVAIATLALAWCRRRPLAVLCVVVAATAVPEIFTRLTITLWGHFVPLLIAVFAVARWCASTRGAVIGTVLAVAALVLMMLRVPSVGTAANIPFTAVPLTAVVIAGRVLRHRHDRQQELVAHAERLESARDAQIAEAVADERVRVARELHDIVAHCVAVMVVQAGAAEELLDRDPDRAREPLRAVQAAGRQAVAELGRMLGLLRSPAADDGQPLTELAPQPGMAQLPELTERMSSLGLPVRLTTVGDPRSLPPGVDLTAYRVVQEALTNALKHGGRGVNAHVELRYLPRSLAVEITDEGRAIAPPGSGHGLIGMAERAAIYGGAMEAGIRPEGGYRVRVELPLDTA